MNSPVRDGKKLNRLCSLLRSFVSGATDRHLSASKKAKGFSLVEVMAALGVLSVAVIPLFGLLPSGISIFREAVDTTIQSQIIAKITTLAEQTDYSNLNGQIATKVENSADAANVVPVYYYFDDQGAEVSTTEKGNAIYTAAVTYQDETYLPNSASAPASKNIATLWVVIYKNRGIFRNNVPVDPQSRRTMIHIANFGRRI